MTEIIQCAITAGCISLYARGGVFFWLNLSLELGKRSQSANKWNFANRKVLEKNSFKIATDSKKSLFQEKCRKISFLSPLPDDYTIKMLLLV